MNILLAPLICTIETSGPMQRAVTLAKTFLQAGHRVAFCTAKNQNYRSVKRAEEYQSRNPEPLGLPRPLGNLAMGLAFRCGLLKRREITSFELVRHLMGILHPSYFFSDVDFLINIIKSFRPHVIYSEFRLSAIVAARLEGVPLVGSCSYPALPAYRCDPRFSLAVRKKIARMDLPFLNSVLDLFTWQSISFIASSPALEPVKLKNAVHVGPFFDIPENIPKSTRTNNIVIYMGNSAIDPRNMLRELRALTAGEPFDLYIASIALPSAEERHLHVAPRFDFTELLPKSALFIHHGGQNSAMSGLLAGVPQLIFPGRVFERCFNADSIVKIGAGIRCQDSDFTASKLDVLIKKIVKDEQYYHAAQNYGKELRRLGGSHKTLSVIEEYVLHKK